MDWSGESSFNMIAVTVRGTATGDARMVCMALNPTPVDVLWTLPAAPAGSAWHLAVNTGSVPPEDAMLEGPVHAGNTQIVMAARSGQLLLAVPLP